MLYRTIYVANSLLGYPASVRAGNPSAPYPYRLRGRGDHSGPKLWGRYVVARACPCGRGPRRRAYRPRRAYGGYGGPKLRGRYVVRA